MHTNDIHSHFENWPKIRRYLQQTKAEAESQGQTVLTFDDGDAMDRFHPLSEATNGQANIQLLNTVAYDAVTIGNNEGIGNSHADLEALYSQANFPVVLGNLFEPDGTRPAFAQPVVYKTTPAGTRIAIIGFTAPFFLTYGPNGWLVKAVGDVLPDLLNQIAGSYDVLIMLSHLGLSTDRYLAAKYPKIDVIIGGHTHHLLEHGELVGHTLLTAAEKYGHYVGRIQLVLNDNHQITQQTAVAVKTSTLPAEPEDDQEIANYLREGHALLAKEPVAFLPESFSIDYDGPSPLLDLGLKAIAEAGQTSASLLNAGLFLDNLPAGLITRDTLHRLLPHPMHLMRVTLRGQDLWRLMMEVEKNRMFLRHFHMVGMSFRGKIFGDIGAFGMTTNHKRQVIWNGQALRPDTLYTFTTVDHFLFIPFFPTIEIMGDNDLLFPNFLRDSLADYLAQHFPLPANKEERP